MIDTMRRHTSILKEDIPGLTRLEFFAGMAIAGVEASNIQTEHQDVMPPTDVAKRALSIAKEMVSLLEAQLINDLQKVHEE